MVSNGTIISIGKYDMKVLEAPGHTPGSVHYVMDGYDIVFCGDTVIKGGIGGSDLSFGDENRLFTTIRDRILTLPSKMILLPAHGPATTISEEKANNLYIQAMGNE
jgi:glyoxylase-like metal-dependent hydrolase (beta-lactamase superfamily II)